jgi:hypothetical protein
MAEPGYTYGPDEGLGLEDNEVLLHGFRCWVCSTKMVLRQWPKEFDCEVYCANSDCGNEVILR